MEQKPLYYDGSGHTETTSNSNASNQENFQLTEEMRANIGRNPYSVDAGE